MPTTANCPACTVPLELPEEYSLGDRAACPNCGEVFGLSEVVPRPLHRVELIKPVQSETPPPAKPAPPPQPQDTPIDPYETLAGDRPLGDSIRAAAPAAEEDKAGDATPAEESHEDYLAELLGRTTPMEKRAPVAPAAERYAPPPTDEGAGVFDEIPEFTAESVRSEPPAPVAEEYADDGADVPPIQTTPRKRKRRHPLRAAVTVLIGGACGCLLGLYGLLYLLGPRGDVLNLAQYLPESALPPAMRSSEALDASEEGEEAALALSPADEPSLEQPAEEDSGEEILRDDNLQTAGAEIPPDYSEPETSSAPPAAPLRDLGEHAAAFQEQLLAAADAGGNLVTGSLADRSLVPVKGQAYKTICGLADECDFLSRTDLTPEFTEKALLARRFFEQLLSSESASGDVSQIAARWWGFRDRPSSGIFFAGQVQGIEPYGDQAPGDSLRGRPGRTGRYRGPHRTFASRCWRPHRRGGFDCGRPFKPSAVVQRHGRSDCRSPRVIRFLTIKRATGSPFVAVCCAVDSFLFGP